MATNPGARPHNFFVIGGYGVLLLGFLIAIAYPYYRDMHSARADIAQFQQEIIGRKDKSTQLHQMTDTVKEITAETRDYDRLVPPNQDLGSFLQELYKQLEDAGMTDVSVHNMPPIPLDRSEKLPIEVKGKGSYAQFRDFLTRLEKLPRLSSVGRLSVDAFNDMNGNVEVQLTLYIYNAKAAS